MVAKTDVGFGVTFSIDWNVDADGDWAVASNWSTGVLPAATDDVDIDTADFHTVTFSSGTATVDSLTVGNDDFVMTGGTLTAENGATFDNGLTIDGGTLTLAGNSIVTGDFSGAGEIVVTNGTLNLDSGGSVDLSGISLSAGGVLDLSNSTRDYTLTGDLRGADGTFEMDGATVGLAGDVYVGGDLDVLNVFGGPMLDGHRLTVAGRLGGDVDINGTPSVFAIVNGPGTLVLNGGADIYALQMYGGGTAIFRGNTVFEFQSTASDGWILRNQGTMTFDGQGTFLGLVHDTGSDSTLINDAGATMIFSGDAPFIDDEHNTARFINNGTIEARATDNGISVGSVSVINNGTIHADAGETDILGPIRGHGTVTVASGATLVFDASTFNANSYIDIASGTGSVSLTGGTGDDVFLFGGNFAATDTVTGGGGRDRLVLHGSYAGAHALVLADATVQDMTAIQLASGFNYDIATADGNVAAGATMRIEAAALSANNHLVFDGSAETDGHFIIQSGLGADTLTGGALSDTFVYLSAADSTGAGYDTIHALDFGSDVLNVHGIVRGIDARVVTSLSIASFDGDLMAALDGHLAAHSAMLVHADAGSLEGKTFLVVDQNGVAGYQSGADLVIHLTAHTGMLTTADFV